MWSIIFENLIDYTHKYIYFTTFSTKYHKCPKDATDPTAATEVEVTDAVTNAVTALMVQRFFTICSCYIAAILNCCVSCRSEY